MSGWDMAERLLHMQEGEVRALFERYSRKRFKKKPTRIDYIRFSGTADNHRMYPPLEGDHWMVCMIDEEWEQDGIDPSDRWFLVNDETGEVVPLMCL
jgi:hypothetical protein